MWDWQSIYPYICLLWHEEEAMAYCSMKVYFDKDVLFLIFLFIFASLSI